MNRKKIWNILKENGYPLYLIQITQSLYNGIEIFIDTKNSIKKTITRNNGVKEGCYLSSTLFNM